MRSARAATRRNHSATHLLHYALRTVVGEQAMQKGSLVGPDRLRFDYAGTRPLSGDEIARIEDLVNERVLANYEVTTHVLPMAEAKARGAIGIFEEKYGAEVRMLTISPDSIELCGGTHVRRTGDIGLVQDPERGGPGGRRAPHRGHHGAERAGRTCVALEGELSSAATSSRRRRSTSARASIAR